MMQATGVLSRRKDGLKIFHVIKGPKILEIVDIRIVIVKYEIGRRHGLLKVS